MKSLVQKMMPGPSCDEVLETLQAYLDGEIDEKQAQKVTRHIDRCSQCDRESKVYSKIKETLASRKKPVDPEIMAAIEQFSQDLIPPS